MKAPISKKVLAILSDKRSSKQLIETAMIKDAELDQEIVVEGKPYKLQRIGNFVNL